MTNCSNELYRWKPFDPARNWPDLGPRFASTEKIARDAALRKTQAAAAVAQPGAALTGDASTTSASAKASAASESTTAADVTPEPEYPTTPGMDKRDLDWSTVLKRTFEAYVRGETPNMYGEWLEWAEQ